jgi:hypothetical protein
MKSLAQTITILITLNLVTANLALAQPAPAPATPQPVQVEAVETAEKEAQLEATRDQIEAARWQIEAAKNTGGKALSKLRKDIAELRFNFGMPFSHSGAGMVLVIPTSEMKAEDLATIVEDMTVMSRIIDSQLGKEESRHMWFTGGMFGQSSMAETMYLQGYGALFLRKVDFPLSPGPAVQEEEEKETTEEGVDPVWEQTKKDIFEPQEERKHEEEQPEEKYDAEKVENLKTNITKALKHASNIRNLKSDESVILAVTGSGSSGDSRGYGLALSGRPGRGQVIVQNKYSKSIGIVTPTPRLGDWGSSPSTVLIIRAKKSDIDSFAKGDLDLDKFQQRVQIFTQ